MEVRLKKWGNSIGLRIPHPLAISWGFDESTVVDLVETEQGLMIRKRSSPGSLEALLASIPSDFTYPSDVSDFVESEAAGQEWL
jgi:antitoxin MazE